MFDVKYDKDGNVISSEPESISEEKPVTSVMVEPDPIVEESAQILESTADNSETVEEPIENKKPETDIQRNLRALREIKNKAEKERAKAEKERDEALLRARKLEEQYSKLPQKSDNNDVDFSLGEDDLVEGKHLKQLRQNVRELKDQLRNYEQRSQTQTVQDRIRYDFPDFNKVVTPDNIELLKHLKPRQAQLLDSSTDLYTTAASAYEMIKEYGIYQDAAAQNITRDKELVQKNVIKPKPTNAISPQRSNSPLTQAHDFSSGWAQNSEQSKLLYKEILEATKGR
jgi:hypothetical protein